MTYTDLINQFLEKSKKEHKWSKVNSLRYITSETEEDEDGFPLLLDEYYWTTEKIGTWITNRQRKLLVSLNKSVTLNSVNNIDVSFGFFDRKTGASTLNFTKSYREEIIRVKTIKND